MTPGDFDAAAGVDALDRPRRDGAAHQDGVQEVGHRIVGGVAGRPGDLERAVDARQRAADDGIGQPLAGTSRQTRHRGELTFDDALHQFDLETVVRQWFRAVGGTRRRVAPQFRAGPGARRGPARRRGVATARCATPADGDPRVADDAAGDVERHRRRGQRELVGLPVADLEVARPARARDRSGTSTADDELPWPEVVFLIRRGAGPPEEVGDGNASVAVPSRGSRRPRRARPARPPGPRGGWPRTGRWCRGWRGCGCSPPIAAHPVPGVRRLQLAVTSRKYRHRGRCMRLPPMEAMLRSCADALSSNASEMTGNWRRTRGSAARSDIRTSEPIRSGAAVEVDAAVGQRVDVDDGARDARRSRASGRRGWCRPRCSGRPIGPRPAPTDSSAALVKVKGYTGVTPSWRRSRRR